MAFPKVTTKRRSLLVPILWPKSWAVVLTLEEHENTMRGSAFSLLDDVKTYKRHLCESKQGGVKTLEELRHHYSPTCIARMEPRT